MTLEFVLLSRLRDSSVIGFARMTLNKRYSVTVRIRREWRKTDVRFLRKRVRNVNGFLFTRSGHEGHSSRKKNHLQIRPTAEEKEKKRMRADKVRYAEDNRTQEWKSPSGVINLAYPLYTWKRKDIPPEIQDILPADDRRLPLRRPNVYILSLNCELLLNNIGPYILNYAPPFVPLFLVCSINFVSNFHVKKTQSPNSPNSL